MGLSSRLQKNVHLYKPYFEHHEEHHCSLFFKNKGVSVPQVFLKNLWWKIFKYLINERERYTECLGSHYTVPIPCFANFNYNLNVIAWFDIVKQISNSCFSLLILKYMFLKIHLKIQPYAIITIKIIHII